MKKMTEHNDIIDLQTRVAYQEDLLTELNQIVTKQDAEILTLKLQIKRLAQRIEDILTVPNQDGVDNGDERPPHY
jgi:SlyX protein